MKTSQNGLDLKKRFEDQPGYLAGACSCLTAYPDPATGKEPWTVGWGHTAGVCQGMTITPQLADQLLQADSERVDMDLDQVFPDIDFTQDEWDALSSLCFNLSGGPRALPHKAPKLTAAIRRGDRAAAAHEFLDMDQAAGKAMAGLALRRKAEAALYLGGDWRAVV